METSLGLLNESINTLDNIIINTRDILSMEFSNFLKKDLNDLNDLNGINETNEIHTNDIKQFNDLKLLKSKFNNHLDDIDTLQENLKRIKLIKENRNSISEPFSIELKNMNGYLDKLKELKELIEISQKKEKIIKNSTSRIRSLHSDLVALNITN